MKLSAKQKKAIHAKGAQIERGRYFGAKGDAITCQKCGAQSDSWNWFLAHRTTHPNFDKEPHYKIQAKLRENPQYRLRRHHLLGNHKKYCSDTKTGCQLSHLGKYKGRLN